jgi:hypothetical protein
LGKFGLVFFQASPRAFLRQKAPALRPIALRGNLAIFYRHSKRKHAFDLKNTPKFHYSRSKAGYGFDC